MAGNSNRAGTENADPILAVFSLRQNVGNQFAFLRSMRPLLYIHDELGDAGPLAVVFSNHQGWWYRSLVSVHPERGPHTTLEAAIQAALVHLIIETESK